MSDSTHAMEGLLAPFVTAIKEQALTQLRTEFRAAIDTLKPLVNRADAEVKVLERVIELEAQLKASQDNQIKLQAFLNDQLRTSQAEVAQVKAAFATSERLSKTTNAAFRQLFQGCLDLLSDSFPTKEIFSPNERSSNVMHSQSHFPGSVIGPAATPSEGLKNVQSSSITIGRASFVPLNSGGKQAREESVSPSPRQGTQRPITNATSKFKRKALDQGNDEEDVSQKFRKKVHFNSEDGLPSQQTLGPWNPAQVEFDSPASEASIKSPDRMLEALLSRFVDKGGKKATQAKAPNQTGDDESVFEDELALPFKRDRKRRTIDGAVEWKDVPYDLLHQKL
ncbi:Hypothetical protein R9X50_00461700 [Acrodontium crateriforme]|uniref:Uncharacterized protein n=1 Tax=Acrodontium crateriforme TaxID=150365 RepID=A0AAQ3M5N6_9PEZI|nr:Hypothetical protein R9X50_00461700 [Acrodontium crateriforme]